MKKIIELFLLCRQSKSKAKAKAKAKQNKTKKPKQNQPSSFALCPLSFALGLLPFLCPPLL